MKIYVKAAKISAPYIVEPNSYNEKFSGKKFRDPEKAIKAWFERQDRHGIDEAAIVCKDEKSKQELLKWALNNQATIEKWNEDYASTFMFETDKLIDYCKKALNGQTKYFPFTGYNPDWRDDSLDNN